MKSKLFFLPLLFIMMSFNSLPKDDFSSFSTNQCCTSYVVIEDEMIPVVTVCGGNTTEDYIANCLVANEIRDALLEVDPEEGLGGAFKLILGFSRY